MRELSQRTSSLLVVCLAFFTDTLLYYLIVPLLPIYSKELGLGQMKLGLLFGSYAVALVVGTVPIGKLADRTGRKSPLLWGLVGLGSTTLIFAVARSYPLLVLARILQGLSATATWTAGMALLADHFPPEHRGKAMGTCFACANAGVVFGPPLSGFLAEHFGVRAPFVFAGCLALLDALARLLLLREDQPSQGVQVSIRALMRDRTVRIFAGAMALGAGLWALLESTLPLHFDRGLHMSPSVIGLCFAAAALAHTFTSPLMGALSDRYGRKPLLIVGLVLALVLVPLPGLLTRTGHVMAALAGLGLTASFIMSPASPALADAVERMGSRSFASVFGILNLAYAAGMMAGPLFGSAIVEVGGIKVALVLTGACFGAYALWVWRASERAAE